MLQNQLTQQDTLEQERLALSQKQRDTLNRPVRYGFMNEGQTSLKLLKTLTQLKVELFLILEQLYWLQIQIKHCHNE